MISSYEIRALYILRGWEELQMPSAWLADAANYWRSRGFVEVDPLRLTAAGMTFVFYLKRGGTGKFAKAELLGQWPKQWRPLAECRELMHLDIHWTELAYQITGKPNNRTFIRAKFDPIHRETLLRQQAESRARKSKKSPDNYTVRHKPEPRPITLPTVRLQHDDHT